MHNSPSRKSLPRLLLASSICGLLLFHTLPAWADYKPPTTTSRIRSRTTTTGIRGGCNHASMPLTVLAPQGHIGQTAATRPTFYWYGSESMPMQFVLDELKEVNGEVQPQQIWETVVQSQPGVMSLTLPDNAPALEPNRVYRWRVVLVCNPNRPSSAIVVEAMVQVVPVSSELRAALAATDDPTQRSQLYANDGFWYDALATAPRSEWRSLLDDLIRVESAAETTPHSQQLQQVEALLESEG